MCDSQGAGLEVVGIIDSNINPVDEGVVPNHLGDARTLTGISTATGVALDVQQGG